MGKSESLDNVKQIKQKPSANVLGGKVARSAKSSNLSLAPKDEDGDLIHLSRPASRKSASVDSFDEDIMVYPMDNVEIDKQSVHSHGSSKMTGKSKQPSQLTSTTNSSITNGNGKQIADTLVRKLLFMIWSFAALVLHVIYLAVLVSLYSNSGMVIPVNAVSFSHAGPVIMEVWAMACYVVTDIALNDALSVFFGYLLTRPDGYSIVVCGFTPSGLIGKARFPNRLSFRSSAKPLLAKASTIFILNFLAVFLALIASTTIKSSTSRVNKGALMCIEYSQASKPFNRQIPTMVNAMGVAELVDPNALGRYRISDPTLPYSTLLFSPQLIDAAVDGTTIIGKGFQADFHTVCECSVSSSASDLAAVRVNPSIVGNLSKILSSYKNEPAWANNVMYDSDRKVINITTGITGSHICGGFNTTMPAVPVCYTSVSNHFATNIWVQYKTDGTSASIAAKDIKEHEGYTKKANMSYLNTAMKSFFETTSDTDISSHALPAHWPGSINPILWMTSQNMQDVSFGLLDRGVEFSMAVMVRESIQRSYTIAGSYCTQNIENPSSVTLTISPVGFYFGLVWIIYQFIINILALLACTPWLVSRHPMLPAIEAAHDPIVFSLLSSKNAATSSRMKGMSSNIDQALMWPRLDLVLRIGESVLTSEDPERGILVLEKPKMVTALSFEKTYF